MKRHIFNPADQQLDLNSKIIAGLERISEAFKALLWEKAKILRLSPIQIQILIFIKYHESSLNNVSHLAREFNLTKPTISDTIRVLERKTLIEKLYDPSDQRRFSILLTAGGDNAVREAEDFASPLINPLLSVGDGDKEILFQTINKLIFQLHRNGVLSVQRNCQSCRFYRPGSEMDYCNLLEKSLAPRDIRIDCPEHQAKN